MKKGEHDVMTMESNTTQPKSTQPNPTQSNQTEFNPTKSKSTQPNSKWCIIGINIPPSKKQFDGIISPTITIDYLKNIIRKINSTFHLRLTK